MKKILTSIVLTICFWPQLSSAAQAPSRDDVLQMVYSEQFDPLEKLVADLRTQKSEFYNGRSQLAIFDSYLVGFSDTTSDDKWEEYIQKLKDWSAAHPESPTPLIALGNTYKNWAWKARGGGWASSVTEDNWHLFGDRLEEGRKYLDQADQLAIKDPELYNAMIWIGIGQGWSKDEIETVFKKGVELDPNDLQLYESKANYLLPRWHGSPGEWEAFAAEAADARGGDEGDILYMDIARSQAWSEGGDFFNNTSISYKRMQRGFEASLKRYPNYTWEMNSYCYFACVADDRDTARKLFKEINGQAEMTIWHNESYFKQWEQWALDKGNSPASANSTTQISTPNLIKFFLIVIGIGAGLLITIVVIIWLIIRGTKRR